MVFLIPFINKPESSRDLNIFIISFIYSSEIINVVPDPKMFFWIGASVAEAVVVNLKGTKILLGKEVQVHFSLMVNQLSLKDQQN